MPRSRSRQGLGVAISRGRAYGVWTSRWGSRVNQPIEPPTITILEQPTAVGDYKKVCERCKHPSDYRSRLRGQHAWAHRTRQQDRAERNHDWNVRATWITASCVSMGASMGTKDLRAFGVRRQTLVEQKVDEC